MKLREKFRQKIRQLQGAPEKVARSFALGSFMGVTPLVGMQILISLILSWIFQLNKSAAIAGVINTNWTKGLYLYPLNYKIGAFLLGIQLDIDIKALFTEGGFSTLIQSGPAVFFSLLLGGFVSGGVLAAMYYHIVKRILKSSTKTEIYHA